MVPLAVPPSAALPASQISYHSLRDSNGGIFSNDNSGAGNGIVAAVPIDDPAAMFLAPTANGSALPSAVPPTAAATPTAAADNVSSSAVDAPPNALPPVAATVVKVLPPAVSKGGYSYVPSTKMPPSEVEWVAHRQQRSTGRGSRGCVIRDQYKYVLSNCWEREGVFEECHGEVCCSFGQASVHQLREGAPLISRMNGWERTLYALVHQPATCTGLVCDTHFAYRVDCFMFPMLASSCGGCASLLNTVRIFVRKQ